MDKPVIIFGAKGIAPAALEIFKSNGIVVYGFLDEDKALHDKEIQDVPILGDPTDHGYLKLIGQKCEAFVASDDNSLRKSEVKNLIDNRKVMPINAIHKLATVSESAAIGHGNFINANVFLGGLVKVGHHNIFNTGLTVDHEAIVGDYVQIGAGSTINSGVILEDEVFIGTGVTIVSGVTIGKKARIGAGSVVISDVNKGETVFGNPAVKIEK